MAGGNKNIKNVLITGMPGCGKTTLCLTIKEVLEGEGFKVGGLMTPEVREGGRRVAFKLVDLLDGEEGLLATVKGGKGPRVGRYTVLVEEIDRVGVKAIEKALREADVVLIDEIGKMELFSDRFKLAVEKALNSEKPVLATLHRTLKNVYRSRGDTLVIWLERGRFNQVKERVLGILLGVLKRGRKKDLRDRRSGERAGSRAVSCRRSSF